MNNYQEAPLYQQIFNAKFRHFIASVLKHEPPNVAADVRLGVFDDLVHRSLLIHQIEAAAESPIELMLAASLCFATWGRGSICLTEQPLKETCDQGVPSDVEGVAFSMQEPVGSFTLDFLFACCSNARVSYFAVECDGHEFHERTKEQASHDKKRDRTLLSMGIPTLRFSGSDIFNRLDECTYEISAFAANAMQSLEPPRINA